MDVAVKHNLGQELLLIGIIFEVNGHPCHLVKSYFRFLGVGLHQSVAVSLGEFDGLEGSVIGALPLAAVVGLRNEFGAVAGSLVVGVTPFGIGELAVEKVGSCEQKQAGLDSLGHYAGSTAEFDGVTGCGKISGCLIEFAAHVVDAVVKV